MKNDFTKEDYLQNLDRLLNLIGDLDKLYNYDFISLEEYFKIKNRILDEIIALRNYEQEQLEGNETN